MTPSAKIEAFIKSFEQCRLHAYMPTPNDRPTCGWGSTGPDVTMDTTWTQEQADERFDRDLARFGGGVFLLLHGPTTQNQYDALVSLSYNIGLGNFARSTVLKQHNAGFYRQARDAFAMWNRQAGKVLPGLTRRRLDEAAVYAGDPPATAPAARAAA